MSNLLNIFFNYVDKQLTVYLFILMLFGLYLIGEAAGFDSNFFYKQCIFIISGLFIYFLVSLTNVRTLYRFSFLLYLISIFLLMLTFFIGTEVNGSKRWLNLILFKFQTSELIKITLPIFLIFIVENFKKKSETVVEFLILSFTLIPFVLILIQPDLGSSLIILFIGLIIIFLNGLNIYKIISGIIVLLATIPYAWFYVLKDYQKSRVLNLFDPFSNPLESGYHSIQSSIAIGSGGLLGKASEYGTQTDLLFLPETHTDFIFAVLAENYGFLGNLMYFVIAFLLISRLVKITLDLHLHSNRLLAVTYVIIFIVCFLINIAMVSGLFPIVGIPLPLTSYGGSSLFIYLIIFGLINALHNRKTLIAN